MTFLFVDYEQGAGGEYFCVSLSQSPQSEKLKFTEFNSGRTKVQDVFNQEFLKLEECLSLDIKIPSTGTKYNIVPTHRNTKLAKDLLKNIKSIRIQYPANNAYFKFLKQQQLNKVLLVSEPNDGYFLGFLKILARQYNNTSFLSKVDKSMDNLSLILLAQGIEPTDENRQNHITKLATFKILPEPEFNYDLTIPYETLFTDAKWIVDELQQKFGIDVDIAFLKKYKYDFEKYQTQT